VGSVTLPVVGDVYVDANAVIYMVEAHLDYAPLLAPVWLAARAGQFHVVTTHLTLMETLVGPLKKQDAVLTAAFEALYTSPDLLFLSLDESVLRQAAALRASIPSLRTPDALHAATALIHHAALFITNDPHFRRVPGLPVTVLSDLLVP
jgi:predicted nucleic acid-binding protein